MTAIEWLTVVALGALALWVVAGVIDDRAARRPLPRIAQSVRHAPPPLPPVRTRPDLPRARDVRAARQGARRHRRPEGT